MIIFCKTVLFILYLLILHLFQDGRLHSGDHIMQIGDVHVRGLGSEQVATVLRQSGSHVRLIVARSVTEPFPMSHPHAPIVPTEQLDEHLHQLYSALLAYENAQSLGLTPEQLEQLSMMGQLPENFLHGNAVSNSFEVHMAVSKLLNNRTVSLSERQNLYGSHCHLSLFRAAVNCTVTLQSQKQRRFCQRALPKLLIHYELQLGITSENY